MKLQWLLLSWNKWGFSSMKIFEWNKNRLLNEWSILHSTSIFNIHSNHVRISFIMVICKFSLISYFSFLKSRQSIITNLEINSTHQRPSSLLILIFSKANKLNMKSYLHWKEKAYKWKLVISSSISNIKINIYLSHPSECEYLMLQCKTLQKGRY